MFAAERLSQHSGFGKKPWAVFSALIWLLLRPTSCRQLWWVKSKPKRKTTWMPACVCSGWNLVRVNTKEFIRMTSDDQPVRVTVMSEVNSPPCLYLMWLHCQTIWWDYIAETKGGVGVNFRTQRAKKPDRLFRSSHRSGYLIHRKFFFSVISKHKCQTFASSTVLNWPSWTVGKL